MTSALKKLFFLIFIGSYAFAEDWTEVGNGGDVLICNHAPTHRMYDAHEAQSRYNLTPQYPPYKEPERDDRWNVGNDKEYFHVARDLAKAMIERLKDKDPRRYQLYDKWISDFEAEVQFLDKTYLIDVPDIGIGALPKGCLLEQLIIQKRPIFPRSKRYTIAHDFWKYMSFEDQAVAIVHELLYRDAREINPKLLTSERVRYFNALIISGEISKMSRQEYEEILDLVFVKP